jgi:pimeloyl-ACP methyl ester carboxylesterase
MVLHQSDLGGLQGGSPLPLSRWFSERLDDAILPLLKVLSPGYSSRLARFRPAEPIEISSLGAIVAPQGVQLTETAPWRGYRVQTFQFTSPVACERQENRAAHGRLISGSPYAPWAVIVPGYATGALPPYGYSLFQTVQGRSLLERGLNVALLDLPYHLKRKPQGYLSGEGFFSPDLKETQSVVRQAAADLIGLVRWLEDRSGRPVALWGTSLGGCVAGLAATQLPELGALGLMEPLDNPGDVMAVLSSTREIREELARHGLPPTELPEALQAVAPSSYPPALPRERILFVTPQWDQIVPTRFQEAFWEAWGRPERIRAEGSHVTVASSRYYTRQVADFLEGWLYRQTH